MSKEAKKKVELEKEPNTIDKLIVWYRNSEKIINVVTTAILVIALLILVYYLWWAPKRQTKAEVAVWKAEQYFAVDSLQYALNGDGTCDGLLSVIKDYSCTKTATRARFMAGSCYLKLGEFDNAIKYLKRSHPRDKMVAIQRLGLLGDAYLEKNDINKAANYYKKASKKHVNDMLTPMYLMRYALVCEMQGNWSDAIDAYQTIQTKYTSSYEAMDVEKRIEYAKTRQ